jgi:hypothetical protein
LPEFHRRNRFVDCCVRYSYSGNHGEPHGPQIETSIKARQNEKEDKQDEEHDEDGISQIRVDGQSQIAQVNSQQGEAREKGPAARIFQQPVFVKRPATEFTPPGERREG